MLIRIDFVGEGHNIIVPPSVIGNGPPSPFQKADIFTWVDGKGLNDLEFGEVPHWLIAGSEEECDVVSDPAPATGDEIIEVDVLEPEIMGIKDSNFSSDVVVLPVTLDSKFTTPLTGDEVQETTVSEHENKFEPITQHNDGWEAPILFDKAAMPEIKADLLPSWLGDYARAISQSKQTPEGMAVMLGLSIIATCVQKKYVVAPYDAEEYNEQLSLWTVTILKSGERKSPVLNAMRAPIVAWEMEQAELLKVDIRKTTTAITVAQKRIEKLQQVASNLEDATERQKKLDEISEIEASMPAEIRAPKLWTSDVTAETLQDMLAENKEKMAVLSDEGNIFEIMAGLYNQGKVNIDIFLQAYSGSPAKIMRKARKVDLYKPALTFGLAVQPVVIEGFASGSQKQFRGKGALGRFLFCIPESMLGNRAAGRQPLIAADIKSRYEEGIKGLLSAPMAVDESGKEIARHLELDEEAIGVYEEFDSRVEAMLGAGGELESMDDWGAKLPGNALRIAGLLHLVEYGPDRYIIGKDTLDRAVRLCDLLIDHAKAAFGLIGVGGPVSDAKRLYLWMQSREFEVFTRTECNDAMKNFGKERLDKALNELGKRNILRDIEVPTNGRNATNYISNPCLSPAVGC